jgi:8-oxo-dGTP diphosphatase
MSTQKSQHRHAVNSPPEPDKEKGALTEVAAGLVFRTGKLLITRRLRGAHLGGLWEFPGGKREPQETFEQCLHRELSEEVGIEVRIEQLIQAITYHYPDRSVDLRFYRCRWLRCEPKTILCDELAWILPAQLYDYKFPAADALLLEKLGASQELWE